MYSLLINNALRDFKNLLQTDNIGSSVFANKEKT